MLPNASEPGGTLGSPRPALRERRTVWRRLAAPLAAALAASVLAACGGGGGSPAPNPPPVTPPPPSPPRPAEPPLPPVTGPGELRGATALTRFTAEQVTTALNSGASKLAGVAPRYAVQTYRLTYLTTDADGRVVLASGLAAVPDKPAGRTSPVLSYQHGTIFKDAEAPSNALAPGEPPIVLASLGFHVVAADYVGYGASRGVQHPYLLSAPTAAAVNDFLTASRIWRTTQGTSLNALGNGQLFLLGYSEGGYATAASLRAMQAETANPHLPLLVAAVAGAGPYHVGVTMDELLRRVKDENRVLGALIDPGFLSRLGSTVRAEVRRALVRELIPDDADVSFRTTFIDNFLADDVNAMERMSNVHDFVPARPLRLFHGPQDRTVPYRASTVTLQTMLQRGARPDEVTLTDCTATPSDHLPCVLPFFQAAQGYLQGLARDL